MRSVWLKVLGIPIHVWDEAFFKKLGALFENFLNFDDDTISRKLFDVARIHVLTDKMGLIDEMVKLVVVGAQFKVWVVEEGGGRSWSPEECGKEGDDVSSEASRDGHMAAGDGRLFSDEENGSPRSVHPSVGSMLESAVKRDVQVEASKAARDLDSLKRDELLNLQVTSGHVASLGQSADVREEEVDRCISW